MTQATYVWVDKALTLRVQVSRLTEGAAESLREEWRGSVQRRPGDLRLLTDECWYWRTSGKRALAYIASLQSTMRLKFVPRDEAGDEDS